MSVLLKMIEEFVAKHARAKKVVVHITDGVITVSCRNRIYAARYDGTLSPHESGRAAYIATAKLVTMIRNRERFYVARAHARMRWRQRHGLL